MMGSPLDGRRSESPRPDLLRHQWLDLCGKWEYEPDPANLLDGDERFLAKGLSGEITVPFPPQSRASGIGDTGFFACMWYRRTFLLDADWQNKRILLNFGGVDSECVVWVNGKLAGTHRGGYDSFRLDITDLAGQGQNTLLLKVRDDLDPATPRGKQAWGSPFSCWYTAMSGIWQPVWLEAVGSHFIDELLIEDADPFTGHFTAIVSPNLPCGDARIELEVRRGGSLVARSEAGLGYPSTRFTLQVAEVEPWSPDSPVLYDLAVRVHARGEITDEVESYVAFRRIETDERAILLNGKPLYLRFVLDQGLWPQTLYTPPSSEALRKDIELARQLGFNGCRKHNKAEDPRYLYWADRLGFLVWAEFPSAYHDCDRSRLSLVSQWTSQIARDRNHPSIMAWVIYNESWGIRGVSTDPAARAWVRSIVRLTRRLDPSRLVIDNDGWEHVDTDCYTFHTYAADGETFAAHYRAFHDGQRVGNHRLLAEGGTIEPRPTVASEIGGIAFAQGKARRDGWGHTGVVGTAEQFLRRLGDLFRGVRSAAGLAGFCYTQLADTEQEINGLLTAERVPKIPPKDMRRIIAGAP